MRRAAGCGGSNRYLRRSGAPSPHPAPAPVVSLISFGGEQGLRQNLKSPSTSASTISSARLTAARILAAWLKNNDFPDRLVDSVRREHSLVLELVFGVIRQYGPLDWMLSRLTARRPRPEWAAVLLEGLVQMFFMERMAEHAAVHETVEAARQVGGERAVGLVNAVLRRAQREREQLLADLVAAPAAVRLSHPELLIQRWFDRYGEEPTRRLCQWNNEVPVTVLRARQSPEPPETLSAAFKARGIELKPHPASPDQFFMLPHGYPVADLPGYAEGGFTVQDPATALAVTRLDVQPGETVLDACAAPGGKTLMMAEAMRDQGRIVAVESVPVRAARLRENIKRLGAPSVSVVEGDAADPSVLRKCLAQAGGQPAGFDAILLDAPCTNTGVIRRRPDARWRFSIPRLRAAVRMQAALLESAVSVLRPGGRLVYSTCSLELEENEEQVRHMLPQHPEIALKEERTLFPPDSGTDGAYAARLVRHE